MKKARKYILALILIPISFYLIFSLLGWFGSKHFEPFRHAPSTYLRIWRQADLRPIRSPAQLKKWIWQIPFHDYAGLNSKQKDQLRQAAYDLVAAFSFGDFDHFLRFRLPSTQGQIDPTILAFFRKYFSQQGKTVDHLEDPRVFFRVLWNDPVRGIGTNRWTHIAIRASAFCVVRTPEMPIRTNLFGLKVYGPPVDTTSFFAIGARFIFDPGPEKIIKKEGKIVHALLWLIVRERSDPQPYPIVCQWYWSPMDKKWLPWLLGDGDVRHKKRHKLVF